MVKDLIGMLFITTLVIVFGTNAVTTQWNMWALIVRFLGGQ